MIKRALQFAGLFVYKETLTLFLNYCFWRFVILRHLKSYNYEQRYHEPP